MLPNTFMLQNQKGGNGKTFLVKHYVYKKAIDNPNEKFLLIGLDPQNELAKEFLTDDDFNYFYNNPLSKQNGNNKVEEENTLYNTLINRKDLAICKTKLSNLDIVPNTILLADADIQLATAIDHKEERLNKALDKIRHLYTQVILDGIPSLGMIALNGLRAANFLAIIIEPGQYSLQAVEKLDDTIEQIIKGTFNHNIKTLGIVLNKYLDRDNVSRDTIKELNESFGSSNVVFKTLIPRRNIVGKTEGNGITTFEYDPENDINIALSNFVKEVEERIKLLQRA